MVPERNIRVRPRRLQFALGTFGIFNIVYPAGNPENFRVDVFKDSQ